MAKNTRTSIVATPKHNPVLERFGLPNSIMAGNEVVQNLDPSKVRELATELVGNVELPEREVTLRLATGFLVQKDRKNARSNVEADPLSFSEEDWAEALQYATENEQEHNAAYNGDSEDGETDGTANRGRKGGAFKLAMVWMDAHSDMTAKEASEKMAAELDINESTALQYAYTFIRDYATKGQYKSAKRGRKGGAFDIVATFMAANPEMATKDAAAKIAAENDGVAESTAKIYISKWRSQQKKGK